MDGAKSCLSEGQCLIQQCVFGCLWLQYALGTLSANVKGCAPVLLKDWHGAFSTGACWLWVELGLSFEMEAFERALTY